MNNFSLDSLLNLVRDPSALLLPQNLIVLVAAGIIAIVGLRLFFGMARFVFLFVCLVLVGVISAGVTYAFVEWMGGSISMFQ